MLYFIVNKTARTGKTERVWQNLEQLLLIRGTVYRAFFTEYEGHASKLAGEICSLADKNKCLVIVGGDGTINEVMNGIFDFASIRVGIIPVGSGNDFARGLRLEKDPEKALERIIELSERGQETCCPTDLGKVTSNNGQNSRIFAISSGIGMDALVSYKALHSPLKKVLNRLHLGKLTYILLTVYTLFSMDTVTARVRFYNDRNEIIKEKSFRKLIFMASMNTFAEGGGVPMAPDADPMDAMLSVCSANGIPKWRTFFCLPLLMAKKHTHLRGFEINNCDHVRLILSKPMTLHMDGEYGGEVTRVEVSCLPQKLRLMK